MVLKDNKCIAVAGYLQIFNSSISVNFPDIT